MSKKIDEALNTTSAVEVSTTPENGCATRKEQLYNTANTLFSVFGKMIFLTILDGGDDEQSA